LHVVVTLRYSEQMPVIKHNPKEMYPQYQSYSHAIEIQSDSRLLMISGLNGYLPDGKTMPETFEEQGDIVWKYLGTLLASANMGYQNLVSLRTYLASPDYDEANVKLRKKYLGSHEVASTVICCQLLGPTWKLELEAIAAE
jgi:2-iminobutanoate/2-iminopropanoate deaminase